MPAPQPRYWICDFEPGGESVFTLFLLTDPTG